jgi:hypothetical protein
VGTCLRQKEGIGRIFNEKDFSNTSQGDNVTVGCSGVGLTIADSPNSKTINFHILINFPRMKDKLIKLNNWLLLLLLFQRQLLW